MCRQLPRLTSHTVLVPREENATVSVEESLCGFDWQVKFAHPVRAGDRLRLRATFTEKRLSSKPGRGVTNWLSEVVNQDDHTVLSVAGASLIATRPRP